MNTLYPASQPDDVKKLVSAARQHLAAHNGLAALPYAARAAAVKPTPTTLALHAKALAASHQYAAAVAVAEKLLAFPELDIANQVIAATIIGDTGQPERALALADAVLPHYPNEPAVKFLRAVNLFRLGRFAEGWQDYESRTDQQQLQGVTYDVPSWRGEDLNNKTILIYAEQGYGDTIQFLQLLPLLKQRYPRAKVILGVPPALFRLCGAVAGADTVITTGAPAPQLDYLTRMHGLGLGLKLTAADIPGQVPYLNVQTPAVPKLFPPTMWNIGLCWAGSLGNPTRSPSSVWLQDLVPLLSVPNTRYHSLQYGEARAELTALQLHRIIIDHGKNFQDLADTAAVITQLDLVITIDTAVAHLAAAMAKPVWLILRDRVDWRWQFNRLDSPWYPTMRLFRKNLNQPIANVIGAIQQALLDQRRMTA